MIPDPKKVARFTVHRACAPPLIAASFFCVLALVGCKPDVPSSAQTTEASPSAPVTQPLEKDLADAFDASTDTLFRAKAASDVKLQPLQDVSIAETPEGFSLTATGIDPAVFLPEFSVKPCVVRVEISSPADTVFQIFYPVGPQAVYSEQNSVTQRIKRGENTLYLRIDKANATGKWRLDPGDVPGRYVINSFEVRGLPPPR